MKLVFELAVTVLRHMLFSSLNKDDSKQKEEEEKETNSKHQGR